jgi:predicted Rdx family selenoprotein
MVIMHYIMSLICEAIPLCFLRALWLPRTILSSFNHTIKDVCEIYSRKGEKIRDEGGTESLEL